MESREQLEGQRSINELLSESANLWPPSRSSWCCPSKSVSGFGWFTPDNSSVCGSTVTIASPAVSSKNGDSMPNGTVCKPACTSLQGQTVFLHVFDTVTAAGDFHIKGFAAFQILGYNFPSQSRSNTGTIKCTGTCTGIIGKFVKFVSLAGLQLGGADLGAETVKLGL